jgi:hypothetical protein
MGLFMGWLVGKMGKPKKSYRVQMPNHITIAIFHQP